MAIFNNNLVCIHVYVIVQVCMTITAISRLSLPVILSSAQVFAYACA